MDIFLNNRHLPKTKRFSKKLKHRIVALDYASDIVRFSFVAQDSISYLDLHLLDARLPFNRLNYEYVCGLSTYSVLNSSIQYPKHVINTEEKCRKILSRTRDFLYRFHLDLPKMREHNLKDGPEFENMINSYHIGKLIVHPNFHFTVLAGFVKEAVKRSDKKLKMIKWLVTFDAMAKDTILSNGHALYFAEYMYTEVIDSAFVRAFLKKLDFYLFLNCNDRPEILEFFLYHSLHNKITLNGTINHYDLLDACVFNCHCLNVGTLLKYQDAPQIPQQDRAWTYYNIMKEYRRIPLNGDAFQEAEKCMNARRFYLLMVLLYLYFEGPRVSAAQCLRLLWNSVPEAFFSFEEIEMTLQAGLDSETIRDVYNFYIEAVGEYHQHVEPRSLMHLSRPVVRRMLWKSGCWIPDGIKLTGLPRVIQSFLNLEDWFFQEFKELIFQELVL